MRARCRNRPGGASTATASRANAAIVAISWRVNSPGANKATGAAATIFVLAPECRLLTGVDPLDPSEVERHVDAVISMLFVPVRSVPAAATTG